VYIFSVHPDGVDANSIIEYLGMGIEGAVNTSLLRTK